MRSTKNRNKVRNATVKLAEEEQYKISLECKRNPKKFWHYINRKTTSKISTGDLQWNDPNGNVISAERDSDKAAVLLDCFSSIYIVEPHGEIDALPNISYSISTSMDDLNITQESIYNKLCDLNISKSPGPDMLHPRVLYERNTGRNSLPIISYI